MAARPRSSARLRSTRDRVLLHDVKNMAFRLRLLMSNVEEHWEHAEFRQTVRELLASTVDRLDGIAGRFSAHEDALLIKVSLDLNGLLRQVAEKPARRGRAGRAPALKLALGAVPPVWGDPFYLGDAFASLLENAFEAAAPEGTVLLRSFSGGKRGRQRAVVEIIDTGAGMTPEFLRDRLFQPYETTKPGGVGLGLATARQIVTAHRGSIRIVSQAGGGTLVRLSFPAGPEAGA